MEAVIITPGIYCYLGNRCVRNLIHISVSHNTHISTMMHHNLARKNDPSRSFLRLIVNWRRWCQLGGWRFRFIRFSDLRDPPPAMDIGFRTPGETWYQVHRRLGLISVLVYTAVYWLVSIHKCCQHPDRIDILRLNGSLVSTDGGLAAEEIALKLMRGPILHVRTSTTYSSGQNRTNSGLRWYDRSHSKYLWS